MSILKIYTFPDLVLAQKAMPIKNIGPNYRTLDADMLETMYAAPGIGLAANQVGILERIIVVDVDFELDELRAGQEAPAGAEVVDGCIISNKNPRVLINPEIVRKKGEVIFEEGCLSVPEFLAEVRRSEEIVVQYLDLDGKTQELEADGLLAICIQHEMDHLDGKLFIDRLSPVKKDFAKKKLLRERDFRDEHPDEEDPKPKRRRKKEI